MSRIGRKPVPVPTNVKVAIADSTIQVEGPKGKLSFTYRPEIDVTFDKTGGQIVVTRHDDERTNRSLHGLTRSLVANMVQGVTTGYAKKLEIVGVGGRIFRLLDVGAAHPVAEPLQKRHQMMTDEAASPGDQHASFLCHVLALLDAPE